MYNRLKEITARHGMKLKCVAKACGLSVNTLRYQCDNGKISVTSADKAKKFVGMTGEEFNYVFLNEKGDENGN